MSKRIENPHSEILNIALIAVGGYFVLKYLGIDLLGGLQQWLAGTTTSPIQATGVTTPITGPVTTATTTNQPTSAVTSPDTLAMVANAMITAGDDPTALHSVDVYNFYYQSVRKVAGPAPETLFPGVDRNKNYSIQEWWAAMSKSGFSGIGVLGQSAYSGWYYPMKGIGLSTISQNERKRILM